MRKTYETYCRLGTLMKTRAATGLDKNTIARYIKKIEDIDAKEKLSSKDRYYRVDNKGDINIEQSPPSDSIDSTEIKDICQVNKDKNSNNEENIVIEDYPGIAAETGHEDKPGETIEAEVIVKDEGNIGKIEKEVIINQSGTTLKDVKNKILKQKLDHLYMKYLEYLDNPSDHQLHKLSLKDTAVIAGILLDKKILIEHKQADVIKNQSIIFNLFGDNKELSSFIADYTARRKKLEGRELKEAPK